MRSMTIWSLPESDAGRIGYHIIGAEGEGDLVKDTEASTDQVVADGRRLGVGQVIAMDEFVNAVAADIAARIGAEFVET